MLERVYGREGLATAALAGISLRVEEGEFLSIMGPSGSGKSTLLRCLGGIDAPSSGTVLFRGHDISSWSNSELARLRREVVSFIPQEADLIETLDVAGNIALPLAIRGERGVDVDSLVQEEARAFGLGGILRCYPRQLSRGQCQLVSTARALASTPELLLADEPTAALDSATARVVMRTLAGLGPSSGTTIVMVTHDASAASWGSRVVFVLDGRVFAEIGRGAYTRREFFSQIVGMVQMMGDAGDS